MIRDDVVTKYKVIKNGTCCLDPQRINQICCLHTSHFRDEKSSQLIITKLHPCLNSCFNYHSTFCLKLRFRWLMYTVIGWDSWNSKQTSPGLVMIRLRVCCLSKLLVPSVIYWSDICFRWCQVETQVHPHVDESHLRRVIHVAIIAMPAGWCPQSAHGEKLWC